jgi:hypothetical protein
MRMRKLGALEVSELGFRALSFASTYGQAPEKAESIRVIRGAHSASLCLILPRSTVPGPTKPWSGKRWCRSATRS